MQARSQRTRRRLVHAGAQTFDRNGFAQATLLQIARAAGMTKGALYFHFGSKDAVAEAVQEQGRALLRDFVQDQWERGVPPVQALIDMTHWLARSLHGDPVIRASFRITNEFTGRPSPVSDFHQEWITEVLRLTGPALAEGEVLDRGPGDGPETLLSAAVCGIVTLAGTGVPFPELSRKVGALWDFLLPALVPPGHVARYRTDAPALPGELAEAA
ncbi:MULTISPECIES: ScbR family autoregulator-binding transcription factor [unclassified Streptomyces]|uniref:ScbR family autoregulator-binding transcription factor n=1 Tax=unclassified Streptomyces TaxID=2593676 RepID=UPI0037F7852F